MANGRVMIDADTMDVQNKDGSYSVDELRRLRVAFPAEDGYEQDCRFCGETIEESQQGWALADEAEPVRYKCRENPDGQHHEPETGPSTWCNSAAIQVDDAEDTVTVSISVGDPRGAFSMTVRKVPTVRDGNGTITNPELAGRLILHVPYPDDPLPHATLGQVRPGTYKLGRP